jgi:hypothetical protein
MALGVVSVSPNPGLQGDTPFSGVPVGPTVPPTAVAGWADGTVNEAAPVAPTPPGASQFGRSVDGRIMTPATPLDGLSDTAAWCYSRAAVGAALTLALITGRHLGAVIAGSGSAGAAPGSSSADDGAPGGGSRSAATDAPADIAGMVDSTATPGLSVHEDCPRISNNDGGRVFHPGIQEPFRDHTADGGKLDGPPARILSELLANHY